MTTTIERLPVAKPIFIVGTGRCGSTAFHRIMGVHPQLMWLSGFAQEFPTHPEWNRWAVTAAGNRLVRKLFAKHLKPGENYGFWYAHAYGFAEPGGVRAAGLREVGLAPTSSAKLRSEGCNQLVGRHRAVL